MIDNNSWDIILLKSNNFQLRKGITSFVNPYSMLLLKNENEVSTKIDQWCIDGISLVNILNKRLSKGLKRYSFDDTSLAPKVFNFAKKHNLKIAVVGTEEKYIQNAVKNIERKYKVFISYYRNGYFKNKSERVQCLKEIVEENVQIVICGMGTPHQESFLIELLGYGWDGYGFTCGGYLHQAAQSENYYPYIFNKLELRWLYRIIDEPKLFKRYFLKYPLFYAQFYSFLKAKGSDKYNFSVKAEVSYQDDAKITTV